MASITQAEITVDTSAVVIVAGDADGREAIMFNLSSVTVYVGSDAVTTGTGFPVAAGGSLSFQTPAGQGLYAVTGTAGNAVRVLVSNR